MFRRGNDLRWGMLRGTWQLCGWRQQRQQQACAMQHRLALAAAAEAGWPSRSVGIKQEPLLLHIFLVCLC